ncbi:putative toxin of a toxin/antitoxin system, PIN domain [Cupriavidus taiwanensis]|uniref:Toxin of a toxin/antitoxin system, PIN domain n=1 Tax=Cupriavidus taiwanensis TaxID=164546 RepID=A0A375C7V4_9BURK|nr:PIN domain-containing protein [Cupriavidus taiwanensis]SOY64212.1 putative toxin of a toxin/antitoxin system, PIN domain [Cupriavidus taiwanensis]
MNVLVDTSVWVGHFRQRNDALIRLMEADQVLTHPLVVAELACGTPPAPRAQTLGDIGLLQAARQATLGEVIALVEREQLYGLGCGLVDVTLLASTLITPGARLWTLDQRLSALALRFGVGYRPRLH